jgi:hypothetical protein
VVSGESGKGGEEGGSVEERVREVVGVGRREGERARVAGEAILLRFRIRQTSGRFGIASGQIPSRLFTRRAALRRKRECEPTSKPRPRPKRSTDHGLILGHLVMRALQKSVQPHRDNSGVPRSETGEVLEQRIGAAKSASPPELASLLSSHFISRPSPLSLFLLFITSFGTHLTPLHLPLISHIMPNNFGKANALREELTPMLVFVALFASAGAFTFGEFDCLKDFAIKQTTLEAPSRPQPRTISDPSLSVFRLRQRMVGRSPRSCLLQRGLWNPHHH